MSATVYDHSRTLLNWFPNGEVKNEMSAWSNVDFNHFSGFATYQVKQTDGTIRKYGFIMGIGNANTVPRNKHLDQHANAGIAAKMPKIPDLPDLAIGGPAFVVIDGDSSNVSSMGIVQSMHDLYRVEGSRMEKAYQARTKADAERRAYLLKNPTVPEDVMIQFWTRNKPVEVNEKNNATVEGAR